MNYKEYEVEKLTKELKQIQESCNKRYYCIFRVGKKFKINNVQSFYIKDNIKDLTNFIKYMKRELHLSDNINIDKCKDNRIFIGNELLIDDIVKIFSGIKLRKNCVIARDLLLTSSRDFFLNKSQEEIYEWANVNIDFLKNEFKDNCVFAALHLDEQTPHIHALIIPKFYNKEKGRYELNNSIYFDGKDKLSKWQDKYYYFISKTFPNLCRGNKIKKSKHNSLQQWYNIVNGKIDINNVKDKISKDLYNEYYKKKCNDLIDVLENKNKYIVKLNKVNKLYMDKNSKLSKENVLLKHIVNNIVDKYKIDEKEIKTLCKDYNKQINNERG